MARIFNLLPGRRRRMERDLDRELRHHLESRIEELMRSGSTGTEARRRAAIEFGGVAQVQEEVRETWTWRWLDVLARDVRYAVRTLLLHRGFAAAAALSLALGIGANTAIFSLVNGVLLTPLPYPEAERLLRLSAHYPDLAVTAVSAREYLEFREANRSFAVVGAVSTGSGLYTTAEVNIALGDRPLRVRSISVDAHLLRPVQGRFFTAQETALGMGGWQRRSRCSPTSCGSARSRVSR
jgi:hypothetical protein